MRAVVLVAALLAGCGPTAPEFGSPEYIMEEGKKEIAAKLKDPSSAQFSDVRISETGAVCGKVNGKNGFGAYSGAGPFVYIPLLNRKDGQPIHEFGAFMEGIDAGFPSDKGWQTVDFMTLYSQHCLGISREQQDREKAEFMKKYGNQ